MQSSTGQYSTHAGEPAHPVQHSVITASSLGFFLRGVASLLDLGSNFNSSGTIPTALEAPVAAGGMRGIIAQKAGGGASILRRPALTWDAHVSPPLPDMAYLASLRFYARSSLLMIVLVLFVLLMLVAPFPVLALPLVVEALVIDVRL